MAIDPIKTLESYKDLEYNWDGYSAEPIGHAAILKAQEIVASDILPFDTAPLPDGGINLEYDYNHDFRRGILIEISPDAKMIVLVTFEPGLGGIEYSSGGVDSVDKLRALVGEFLDRQRAVDDHAH